MTTQETTWEPCTEETFWEMLGCVPPAYQKGPAFLVGEPFSHRRCKITGEIRATYQGHREITHGDFQVTSEPVTRPELLELLKA
jgi:hypothetical protein